MNKEYNITKPNRHAVSMTIEADDSEYQSGIKEIFRKKVKLRPAELVDIPVPHHTNQTVKNYGNR